jgi:hypothetical protein
VTFKTGILCAIKTGLFLRSIRLAIKWWKRGFIALIWLRQGHAGPPQRPDLPYARLLAALKLRPRRAQSSAKAASASVPAPPHGNEILLEGIIISVLIAQHCPVLVAPRQKI